MNETSPTNAPEYSVSELSGAIKRTVEDNFERVRVRGEISGYRGPHSSGHCYFALKDQNAKIEAVIWKGTFGRLKFRPEEGMEVIATGKVTTFAGKSSYQIVIDQLEPAGIGALLAQLEARKKALAAEGLFDEVRKRPLPFLPLIIGVVTSPTGAVIRDIIHRIEDRFPRHVLVWPVRVQGETSAAEVAAAIAGFSQMLPGGNPPRPDMLIVARGGGSLEDLWGFNEEIVARAAAASEIPLVSAVGHETDWTLIDFVSDRRAPTPTGAAEFAVPVRNELIAQTRQAGARLGGGLLRLVERRRSEFRSAARALPSPEALIGGPRQRLDFCGSKLPGALRTGVHRREIALGGLSRRLGAQSPEARMGRLRERLDGYEARLKAAFRNRLARDAHRLESDRDRLARLGERPPRALLIAIERRRQKVTALGNLLNTLGYRQVLARGYAIIRDESGAPIRLAQEVGAGMRLDIGFSDGEVSAVAEAGGGPGERPTPNSSPKSSPKSSLKPAPAKPAGGQGSLF